MRAFRALAQDFHAQEPLKRLTAGQFVCGAQLNHRSERLLALRLAEGDHNVVNVEGEDDAVPCEGAGLLWHCLETELLQR